MKTLEDKFEALFFAGRWLLAPFFFGLLDEWVEGCRLDYLSVNAIFRPSPSRQKRISTRSPMR